MIAPLVLYDGSKKEDLSSGWMAADYFTLSNTLFINNDDKELPHYSIDETQMKSIRAIIIFEKEPMQKRFHDLMNEKKRSEYILMSSEGMRTHSFLAIRLMFYQFAKESGVKLEEYCCGDVDIHFMKLAHRLEYVQDWPTAEKCLLSKTKIVCPLISEISINTFPNMTEQYKNTTSDKLTGKNNQLCWDWLQDCDATIYINQSIRRRKMIYDYYETNMQFQIEMLPIVSVNSWIMSFIETDIRASSNNESSTSEVDVEENSITSEDNEENNSYNN